MYTHPHNCSAENLLAGGEVSVKKGHNGTTPATDTVTIRLLETTIQQYEALAAARSISRSKCMALVLEDRFSNGEVDHALASLSRIIAIHEQARREGVGFQLICELRALIIALSNAVRGSYAE